jgi:glutathione S-transferase
MNPWLRLDSFGLQRGRTAWLGNVLLTRASPYPTHLVLHWQAAQKEPWFLATNLAETQPTLRLYRVD